MDTKGHRQVLAEAAGDRLNRAVRDAGLPALNLRPLFLGNWLADMSQVRDPRSAIAAQIVADVTEDLTPRLAAVRRRVSAALQEARALVRQDGKAAPLVDLDAAVVKIVAVAEGRANDIAAAVRALTVALSDGASSPGDGRSAAPSGASEAATFSDRLMALVRVIGFCKFAQADPDRGLPGTSFETYTTIFEELCRQYFPHEHLDRPLCAASYGEECEAAWGPEFANQRKRLYAVERLSRDGERHIYRYLVDDRLILAGRLAEIDHGWASQALARRSTGSAVDDDLWLARLGHALHGVEDFFAHSTFVEHAITAQGEPALRAALSNRRPRSGRPPVGADVAATKVHRRLLRYLPGRESVAGIEAHPREGAVVTGYFDAWDTLNSLLHFVEELLGPHVAALRSDDPAVVAVAKEIVGAYGERTGIDDVLDLLELAGEVPETTYEAKARRAITGIVQCFSEDALARKGVDRRMVEQRLKKDPVLGCLPPPLLGDHLAPAILWLIRTVPVGRDVRNVWTVWKALAVLMEFGRNPARFLLKPLIEDRNQFLLRASIGMLVELAGKPALARLEYLLADALHKLFRADRVGCHSLLSKDVPEEPLFDQMYSCARHVDWFVTDALCRWSDEEWVATTPPGQRWIRWEELVGFFLRSPIDTPTSTVRRQAYRGYPATVEYDVSGEGETFQSIHQRVAAQLGVGESIRPYEDLLQANLTNFDTSRLTQRDPVAGFTVSEAGLAEAIELAGLGMRTRSGYTLRRGATVTVPISRRLELDTMGERQWYWDAMDLDDRAWSAATREYEATRLRQSNARFSHYRWSYFTGTDERTIERARNYHIERARKKRVELERMYNER